MARRYAIIGLRVRSCGNRLTSLSAVHAGEVKYKVHFGVADLRQLERHLHVAGDRARDTLLAAWSKTGVSEDVRRLRPALLSFTADDVVTR